MMTTSPIGALTRKAARRARPAGKPVDRMELSGIRFPQFSHSCRFSSDNALDLECTRSRSLPHVVTETGVMKIGSLAKKSGLSAHTLRYYERIGLLPYADRDRSGQRDYDVSILTWIEFLGRLKTTDMPIRDMLRYAEMAERGDQTFSQRRELLESHRDRVKQRLAELSACLRVLDTKIASYAEAEERTKDDKQHAKAAARSGA
jgi:DNA-binding transcriptional MerR regulator